MGLPANMDYGMYLNIGFWAVLGLGLLIGFARGFKKSLFSFVTTVIFYVVFFLTIDLAVNFLWTLSIPPLGGWVGGFLPSLGGITTIGQAVPILLNDFGASFLGTMATNEQLLALAEGIGIFALKIVYTLLYFTVINLVYRILCAILRAIFSPHSKTDDKYASKNRVLGGVFGLAGGVLSIFVTLIMLGGLMSVVESLVALVPTDQGQEIELRMPRQELQDLGYSVIPVADPVPGFEMPAELDAAVAELNSLVSAYDANLFVTLASEVTMTDANQETIPLNLYLFDEVLSFQYTANALDPVSPIVQVSIRKELTVFAELGGLVLNSGISGTDDLQNVTGEQITSLFEKLSESDLVTSLLPLGIEYGAQMIQESRPDFNIPIPREELYAMDWSAELQNLGLITASLVEIAQTSGILDAVMNQGDFNAVTLDGEDIRNLFADLADSQLITLVALVAVEPALEAMGDSTVALILTLPEDLDWSAELTAIGDVLGAILDTGLTIGDFNAAIENQDYATILQALADIDFNVLTESRIVKQALINVLSGAAQIQGLEFLVIPEGIDWDVELENILTAVNVLVDVAADFDFSAMFGENPDMTQLLGVIGGLTETDIDTLFQSTVLVATLSNLLLTTEITGFELIVPDDILVTEGDIRYIQKSEFVNLALAAQTVVDELACDEGDTECTIVDINKATSLSETSVDSLLASRILGATVGHLLFTLATAEGEETLLVIPDEVKDLTVEMDGLPVDCVSPDEIRNLFGAIRVLDIDVSNFQFDASILNNLSLPDDPGTPEDESQELDPAKLNDLFASVILRATITHYLTTMDLGGSIALVLPDSAMEAGKDYLSVEELTNALKAMKLVITFNECDLEVDPDCQAIDFDIATVLNLADDEIDVLLGSEILNATIGHYLITLDLEQDVLTVPASVIGQVLADGVPADVVVEAELRAIFKAVGALGITDFESVDLDASIINDIGTEDDPLTPDVDESQEIVDLCGSVIIRATITNLLDTMDLGETATILVPDSAMDAGQDYLSASELENVVKAMKLVIDFEGDQVNFDIASVLNLSDAEVDVLLASDILTATIGHYLISLDLDSDILTVPATVIVQTDVEGIPDDIVVKAEIRAIFKAVGALGITDFESVDLDASIISDIGTVDDPLTPEVDESQEIVDLCGSVILRATITDLLESMDLGSTAAILVPDSAMELGQSYLSSDELQNLVKAMKLVITTEDCDLNPDPACEPVSFDIASVLNLSDADVDVLLASEILSATIGSYLVKLDVEQDVLVVPAPVIVQTDVDGVPKDVVLKAEIEALFKAVGALGITDFESVDLDASILSDIGTEDDPATVDVDESQEVVDLCGSVILRATITDLLKSMDLGSTATILVPDSAMELGQDYLSAAELENMVKAMKLVITTEDCDLNPDPACEPVSFDIASVLNLSDADVDVLLASDILSATIGSYLVKLDVDQAVLTVPATVIVQTDVDGVPTDVVLKAEIEALFKAVGALGISDFETVDLDASILSDIGTEDDPATVGIDESQEIVDLCGSVILRATITDLLKSMDLGSTATILLPDSAMELGQTYLSSTELENMVKAMKLVITTNDCDIDPDPACEAVSFDIASVLNLSDADVTVLLSSDILSATIGSYLVKLDVDQAVLTVPASIIVQTDVEGVPTDVVEENEIKALFKSVRALGIDDFETVDLDASILSDIGTEDDPATVGIDESQEIVDLCGSVIIRATITDLLDSMDLGSTAAILVPSTALDAGQDYLSALELENMVKAMKLVITTDAGQVDFNIDAVLSLTQGQIDTLLSSVVVSATIGKYMYDMTDTLTVPTTAVVHLTVDGADTPVVSSAEIDNVLSAVAVLGFTSFDTFTFDAGIIQNLSLADDPETPADESVDVDESKLDTLFTSVIIRATMSKMMLDLTGPGAFVVIPAFELDELNLIAGPAVRETVGGVECITQTELEDVLRALFYLDISDLDAIDAQIDLAKIIDNSAVILQSSILQASITKQLLDTETTAAGAFIIPDYDEDDVQILFDISGSFYLTTVELSAVFDALDVLGLADLNNFSGDVDLANVGEGDNAHVLAASSIIQATVSKQVNDLADAPDPAVLVPDTAVDGITAVRKTVQSGLPGEIRYIAKDELESLLLALDVLGITQNVSSFGGNIDLTTLYDNDPDQTILLDSAIIHATISDQVLGLGAALSVPDRDVADTTDLKISVGAVTYLEGNEIKHLIDAIGVLFPSGVDLDAFSGTFDLASLYDNEADQDKLLLSASIHATISGQVLGLGAALTVPSTDVTGATPLQITVSGTTFVEGEEVKHLINAIGVLFPLGVDLDAFSGNFDLASLYDDSAKQDKLLLSASIHATISGQVLGLGAALTVPTTDVTGLETIQIAAGGVTFVEGGEIKHLINAIGVLFPGGVDLDAFSGNFDLASLYDDSAKQDKLLLSASIHATISGQVLGLGAALTVPSTDVTGLETIQIAAGGVTFVEGGEIKHLINAIGVLFPGGVDLDAFSGNFDLTTLYDNGPSQDKLLLSASIHATISGQVLGLGAALSVPDRDVADTTDIQIAAGGVTFVAGSEVKHLINAIGVLFPGGVELDAFSGTFDLADLYDNEADQDKLLLSASIHATISDQILGLGAALTVPTTDVTGLTDIRLTVSGTTFVEGGEVKNLINAIGVLFPAGVQLDAFSGTFDLADLYDNEADQDKLLLSASIHATISGQILGLGAALTVPTTDVTGLTTIRIAAGGVTFVEGGEVKDLINAIGVLFPGGVELDAFSGTFNLASLYDNGADQDKLLLSASIHATISGQVIDLGTAGTIVLPETGYDELLDIQLPVSGTTFIAGTEIKHLINSLGVLFPSGIDLDAFSGAINLASLYDNEPNQTKLLASCIIHATVSDQILGLTGALVVPDTDVDGLLDVQHPVDGTTYLLDAEIKNLINGLKLIGFGNSDISAYGGTISLASLVEGVGLTQAEATANQNKLLLSAILQATIADTLFNLPDLVLIVPSVDENAAAIIVAQDVDFIVKAEIRALIDGFGKMGFTDLDSFGASISSSEFFAQRDVLLLSASMQATISDKMLNGTGGALIVPDDYRVDATNCTLILLAEIEEIMDVLDTLGLENFGAMSFAPATIFTMAPADLLSSGSMRATISDTLLADASDETAADGFAGLIVPLQARITISVGGVPATSIEDDELLALVTSLKMLNVSDFGDSFSAAAIMAMDEAELTDFLASNSMHLTLHKMLAGNPNLTIPAICTYTMYAGEDHPIASVTTTGELVDFILAVQILGGGDFTNINIDNDTATAIVGMSEANRAVVLQSYIVRFQVTPAIKSAVEAQNTVYLLGGHPENQFNLNAEDYELGYVDTLLTYAASLDIMGFLNGELDVLD